MIVGCLHNMHVAARNAAREALLDADDADECGPDKQTADITAPLASFTSFARQPLDGGGTAYS